MIPIIINKKGNVTAIIAYLEEDNKFIEVSQKRNELKNQINKDSNVLKTDQLKEINKEYETLKDNYNKNRHSLIKEILSLYD